MRRGVVRLDSGLVTFEAQRAEAAGEGRALIAEEQEGALLERFISQSGRGAGLGRREEGAKEGR